MASIRINLQTTGQPEHDLSAGFCNYESELEFKVHRAATIAIITAAMNQIGMAIESEKAGVGTVRDNLKTALNIDVGNLPPLK